MKTQEEYAHEIDEIVRRDVESCQSDWFKIDKEIFMQPKNKNKIFILGTRKTGCDLIILGGTNCDEGSMDWLFGSLGNENFYVCQPLSFYKSQREIQKVNPLYAFKVATAYFREQGKVPVFEDSNLIGITPIYKIRLWSEEVKVVNDKMTNMKTRTYEGVQHGDWVRCVLCGAQMLLPCGADKCPECSSEGTLTWVDEDKQEMDAKHLDCLVPIRKLELQEYLSPEILNHYQI